MSLLTTSSSPADGKSIRTPDQHIRVFVSSTLEELAEERRAVRAAIERLHLSAVMFEIGARPHSPRDLYRAYLQQSHIFVGLYHQRYGWVAPGEEVSGLEDEFRLSEGMPRLLYLKRPADQMEPRLLALLQGVSEQGTASYRQFADADELARLVEDDLAAVLSERFLVPPLTASASSHPPLRTLSPAPVPLTPTIGRDGDVARIVELLTSGVRLLTVTGAGGIGKSRLSLEVARAVADHFTDGVVFVPLEDVVRAELVLPTIAARLHAPDPGNRTAVDVLVDELGERHVLLVVDNMEQVMAAAPGLAELLGRCPSVSALVTSRQVLRLRGEREYHLAPLAVPDRDSGAETSIADVASVDLFVQRAVAANPDFQLTAFNRGAVAELVRLLDGLPLAIELAAARTRLLSVGALLERLSHRMDLLAGGADDLPLRQRTLRATLDWSLQLLDPAELALFARLSIFARGATLDAVEAICGDEEVPDPLGTVLSLLEKSLLISSAADEVDPTRIRMLGTIRSRAAELLAERGEEAAVRGRHARWYAELAEPADVLRHRQAPRYWPALGRETDNLRVAGQWAIQTSDGELIMTLARRLWPWLWTTGRMGWLRDAVSRAMVAVPDGSDPAHLGYLCYVATYTEGLAGDFESGLRSAERAIVLFEQVQGGDKDTLVALARLTRGTLRMGVGQSEGVEADFDMAVATARQERCAWLLGFATSHRGLYRAMHGDTPGARLDHQESLSVANEMGLEALVAQAIGQLAMLDGLEGRLDDGLGRVRSQVEHLRHTSHLEGLANALDTTAALAVVERRWDLAGRSVAAAEILRDRIQLAAWPLIREYHEASVRSVETHLDRPLSAIRADLAHADPWSVIDAVLAELG